MTSRLALVLCALLAACGRKSSTSEAPSIRPAEPAAASKSADPPKPKLPKLEGTAPYERGPVFSIHGSLARLSEDGKRVRIEETSVGDAGEPTLGRVTVLDRATFAPSSSRDVAPEAIATSFGAETQLLKRPTAGLELLDAPSGKHAPIAAYASIVGASADAFAMSDDGKLVAGPGEVRDVVSGKVVCTYDSFFAGGADPSYRFFHGSRWLVVANGRGTVLLALSRCAPAAPEDPLWVADAFDVSADDAVLLEMPYVPFAVDPVDEFVVRDAKTGDERRRLSLKIPLDPTDPSRHLPFAAALAPKGDYAFVAFGRELRVIRLVDDVEVHRERLDALIAEKDDVFRLLVTPTDELLVVVGGKAATLRFAR